MPKSDRKNVLNIVEPRFIDKLRDLIKDKKRLWKLAMVFSIAFFVFVLAAAAILLISFLKKKDLNIAPAANETSLDQLKNASNVCDGCQRRQLDGVFVPANEADLPVVAVMIDNHPDARPAFGIDKAQLVYEAEVEGRFTRYMAVFSGAEDIPEIGPVRSARPYFLDWANEFSALYCHCGGSPQALAEIVDKGMSDLNEFYNGQYYWRDERRTAPHNIITSSEKLRKAFDSEGAEKNIFTAWKYKEDSPMVIVPYPSIEIKFVPNGFNVKWEYDKDKNSYLRHLAGQKDLTAAGAEIWAKNIILQYIPAKVIDDQLRLRMDNTGWGKAVICLDGTCTNGEWAKGSAKERTLFRYEDGEEVEFNPGMTWIDVIRPDIEVIF